ncbi:hypothetical protein C8D92_105185 [Tamilnaduibacter salinus]|uniref:Tetratricopeptide repeat protein n=1 Tax=Tamilnaduibacter salinus TaxID=1484056 RepID=A0A2U1CWQ4_9GAMM|nr:hypothetical protein [Tamilnaduibacter salinus]PVY76432.1 hypothetical protein C8D92_105185 [Tamilnaduibacter salinus]
MPTIRLFLILALLHHLPAFACEQQPQCSDCPETSGLTAELSRFYGMESLIGEAYQDGDYDRVKALSREYLALAADHKCDWNYGNAIHFSHRILGLVSLETDDVASARQHLIEAGQSPGSPQLDSFGPTLDLARAMLSRGEHEAVVEYLEGIRSFWEGREETVDDWIQRIQRGETVDLHPNQHGTVGTLTLYFSLAWPLIVTAIFWLGTRRYLPNRWSFPVFSILAGYIAMAVGGIMAGPVVVALMDIVSVDLLAYVATAAAFFSQYGLPVLAVFLIARVFKRRA